LKLLIERKVADSRDDKLRSWEYEGMIKWHIEKCSNCRKFLVGIYGNNNILDADFYEIDKKILRKSKKRSS